MGLQYATSGVPASYGALQGHYQYGAQPAYAQQYYMQPQQQVQQVQYIQQPRTVQVPNYSVVHDTREVTMTRPKVAYTSEYVMVPKTVQVPQVIQQRAYRTVSKEIFETKMIAVQVPRMVQVQQQIEVDKEIQVPKVVQVEREIRIPQAVMETRTVKVPRQRVVIDHEEHTFEVEATEEYTHTVTVPRTVTTMENVQYSGEQVQQFAVSPTDYGHLNYQNYSPYSSGYGR